MCLVLTINRLKPVTYSIDETKYAKFIGIKDSSINADKDAFSKASKIRTGFVAQDVEKSAREINYDFDESIVRKMIRTITVWYMLILCRAS